MGYLSPVGTPVLGLKHRGISTSTPVTSEDAQIGTKLMSSAYYIIINYFIL